MAIAHKLFFFSLPPMPRNQSHSIQKGGFRKTEIAREFCKEVSGRLRNYPDLKGVLNSYSNFKLSIIAWTPKSIYFTESGEVSKTSVDFDAHKIFVDELFKYLGGNDGQVTDARIQKKPIDSEFWSFEVVIEVIKGKEVCQNESMLTGTLNLQGYLILRSGWYPLQ